MTVEAARPVSWRRVWRLAGASAVALVALAVGGLALLAEAAPARLSTVTPANGAGLAAPPTAVSLAFTEPVEASRVHVALSTADGRRIAVGAATRDGNTVVLPVRASGGGGYLLGYHVVLPDGAEASGVHRFTVAGGPMGAGEGDPAAVADAAAALARPAADGAHAHGRVDALSLAILGLDAFLIVVVVTVLLRRPRPH